MSTIPSKSKLDSYVKMGLVRSQKHPALPLNIYVYTVTTTYERLWNAVTLACRGLVLDDRGRCVVRCLPKFFNEDELHALCDLPIDQQPVVYDKLDGSLIQVVNDYDYGLVVTSKGSFSSKQAEWATKIIQERYKPEEFYPYKTYIFELIHPDNRIVLDYGDQRGLYLLAVRDTEVGHEYDIFAPEFANFEKVSVVPSASDHMSQSRLVEGVVVKTGDHRYKLKTGEYLRRHRIVTEFTAKRVWEALRDGDSLGFENMPEEFDKWLKATINDLKAAFDEIHANAETEYNQTKTLSDKEVGLSQHLQHKSLVFMLRNGKSIAPLIWKMVRPKEEVIDEDNN